MFNRINPICNLIFWDKQIYKFVLYVDFSPARRAELAGLKFSICTICISALLTGLKCDANWINLFKWISALVLKSQPGFQIRAEIEAFQPC